MQLNMHQLLSHPFLAFGLRIFYLKLLTEGWNKGNHFGGSCQLVQSRSALE